VVEHVLAKDETGVRFSLPALGVSKIDLLANQFSSDDVLGSSAYPHQNSLHFCVIIILCTRGEMDITTRFGRVIVGSSPAGCAKFK
jgi:hypothetical protein